jgi:nitrogen fixation protein NifU and related proteins
MNIYQQQILDNYHNPQNYGKPAKYSHSINLQNTSCGDAVTMYLNVENDVITDIHFEAEGCAISIAAASILSEELKGKSVNEIAALDADYVQDLIGIKLSISRVKCAHMPLDAILQAVKSSQK